MTTSRNSPRWRAATLTLLAASGLSACASLPPLPPTCPQSAPPPADLMQPMTGPTFLERLQAILGVTSDPN